MTLEVDKPGDKPGARHLAESVAGVVHELTGIPDAHLEISTGGGEGREEVKVEIKSDLPGHEGNTLAVVTRPV